MPESRDASPGEDYFNDLSQQMPPNPSTNGGHPVDSDLSGSQGENGASTNGQVPKPKRIACVLCRKRKLKCDGNKPACGTCSRLQHDCSYDEVRRKSGPKRGYVKALEARLAQVETMLKTQDDQTTSKHDSARAGAPLGNGRINGAIVPDYNTDAAFANNLSDTAAPQLQQTRSQGDFTTQTAHSQGFTGTAAGGAMGGPAASASPEEPFPWEMIGLGLDEPLPNQDVINELNQAYFEKIHPSVAMIHRPRYYAAMNLAPHMRPPVCLRYAMWCNAAGATEKYEGLQEHFYLRARKYAQQDEMKGHGESMITIAHCQTWVLLASYEFKLMYFPRAWVSSGRACRLAQMMGLHRLDGNGLDVKQCLPPPKDWTEREERRRTFWMSFCIDRYSSIGTGWPMTYEERDIMSHLPSSEEAFELSRPVKTMELADALKPDGPANLSSFSGVITMACLFGRNLTHLHRPSPDDNDDDLNGEFWKRHRELDNILSNSSLSLPSNLRLPSGLNNPNIVFMNMNIHTSTICLHQAAIFKADKNRMPARISAESKIRCITAAAEIASIMRQVCHVDLSGMNPFISFCLYVAARVFVQYLKSRPTDAQVRASLQFLLQAMHALKRRNPLTESFLVQLDVDLEGAGLDNTSALRAQMPRKVNIASQNVGCPIGGHDGTATDHPVTFGDPGLALYNQPEPNPDGTASKAPEPVSMEFNLDISDPAGIAGVAAANQFNLPNRQRTPGTASSDAPNGFLVEMDTSPDGSGGDQQTPGSTSQLHSSSHTSNSAYSPQQDLRNDSHPQDPNHLVTMFDPANSDFTRDFEMHNFPAPNVNTQQSGYVLPQNWASTAGPQPPTVPNSETMNTGNMDLIGMSEAEWSQVLETFNGWETGLSDDHTPHQMSFGRRV